MDSEDKEKIQLIAENIALEEHKKEYYDLDSDEQLKIYRKAEEEYNDNVALQADMMRDALKDGSLL